MTKLDEDQTKQPFPLGLTIAISKMKQWVTIGYSGLQGIDGPFT